MWIKYNFIPCGNSVCVTLNLGGISAMLTDTVSMHRPFNILKL